MTAVVARRAGRIAFGLVLLVGMGMIVLRTLHGDPRDAGFDLALTWGIALVIGVAARALIYALRPIPGGDALLRASLVVPALGLAAALPLSLHGLCAVVLGSSEHAYDDWFDLSLRIVGFAHVVFMLLFAVRARQLATTSRPSMSIGAIYLWSILASAVPFGLWILPEVITAVTGIPIVALLFAFDGIAERERGALPALPAARVIGTPCRG